MAQRTASSMPAKVAASHAARSSQLKVLGTALASTITLLVVLLAARNSIVWWAARFWGASHDMWSTAWSMFMAANQHSPFIAFVLGQNVVHMVLFWAQSSIFAAIDLLQPACLMAYKVQDANMPLDRARFWNAVRRVLFNQVVVNTLLAMAVFPLFRWRGTSFDLPLPTFHRMLGELVVFVLAEEVGFYYSHRLLHVPWLYKRFHKIHHEWTAPIGLTCIYAHPLEHVLSNMMPVLLGPFIIGSHAVSLMAWMTLAVATTIVSHSGYHFPLLSSPEAHDFHHLRFNQNFGALGLLDRLHGTNAAFLQSAQYARHFVFVGTQPLRRRIPDVPARGDDEARKKAE